MLLLLQAQFLFRQLCDEVDELPYILFEIDSDRLRCGCNGQHAMVQQETGIEIRISLLETGVRQEAACCDGCLLRLL